MKRHGLYYALVRADENADGFKTSPVVVSNDGDSLEFIKQSEGGRTVEDFIESNKEYLQELTRWMETYQIGL